MKVELVKGYCGSFLLRSWADVRDEERVWWKCDTLYFGSLAIDDGSCDGLRGRVDFAVVVKREGGNERSRFRPYGRESRLGVNLCGRSNRV